MGRRGGGLGVGTQQTADSRNYSGAVSSTACCQLALLPSAVCGSAQLARQSIRRPSRVA